MANYYVSPTGNDGNAGTEASPLLTIATAMGKIVAGDTVLVRAGTYTEDVTVSVSGISPSSRTRLINYPGEKPKIVGGASAITVAADNVDIVGFDVSATNFSGIFIGQTYGTVYRHHVTVSNCTAQDCGGNGIAAARSDYIIFEDNVSLNNSRRTGFAESGFSIYQATAFDQLPGFHNIVRRNISANNVNRIVDGGGEITDGNGIIIDDSRNTQNGATAGNYAPKTLVEDNVCFYNGGRGVHVFSSDNVTVRNNVAYGNLRSQVEPIVVPPSTNVFLDASFAGEFSASFAKDCEFYNNIAYTDRTAPRALFSAYDDGVSFTDNVYFNGVNGVGLDNSTRNVNLRNEKKTIAPLLTASEISAASAYPFNKSLSDATVVKLKAAAGPLTPPPVVVVPPSAAGYKYTLIVELDGGGGGASKIIEIDRAGGSVQIVEIETQSQR
jgi:parallel beta-helix repeat protein